MAHDVFYAVRWRTRARVVTAQLKRYIIAVEPAADRTIVGDLPLVTVTGAAK
jgi:hypothetical protein